MIDQIFRDLCSKFSDEKAADRLWKEIAGSYSGRKRHYHNFDHLRTIYIELYEIRNLIEDWDTLLFALFYHDIIYHISSKDNEEKSAALAKKRLTEISYPEDKISRCCDHIIATKTHVSSTDSDTNYFTDGDLSILGKPWPVYQKYVSQIRKEYSFFPDFVYKPGRKKVLQHFLEMPQIFKTDHFRNLYATQARENLLRELSC